MADAYKFELVSPERLLVSEEVEWVVVPGTEGEMTVMAQHAPVMTVLKPGIVKVRFTSGNEDRYIVFGGFADILPDTCTLLAESAVRADDLDREDLTRRIEETRKEAEGAEEEGQRSAAAEILHELTMIEHTVSS